MTFLFGTLAALVCLSVSQAGKIDEEIFSALKDGGSGDVLVDFDGGNSRAIESIRSRSFQSRASQVTALTNGLKSLSSAKQGPLQTFLAGQGVQHTTFWSSNQMVVRGAGLPLVQSIAGFKQVSNVQLLPKVNLAPVPSSVTPNANNSTVQWGVAKIKADKVWEEFGTKGEGVVVANIDTGVFGTHEALQGNWRSDYGWFDPYNGTAKPNDQNGHGTHTMGTIAGTKNGIGVAPGAQWIACKGCSSSSCDGAQLLACGQWILEPTKPDGSSPDKTKIPDLVSNSWGGQGTRPWYNKTIEAWAAAGILSVFAIGNSGPLCDSTGSPGNQPSTFSVGSTDEADKLSLFSSKGPVGAFLFFYAGYIKPEVSAPGSDITSAWYTNTTAYNTISGTSMATPHVAGTMALMLSAYRNKQGDPTSKLAQSNVEKILEQTAVRKGLKLSTLNTVCPYFFGDGDKFPNNQFGYGRIDALAAVNATSPMN